MIKKSVSILVLFVSFGTRAMDGGNEDNNTNFNLPFSNVKEIVNMLLTIPSYEVITDTGRFALWIQPQKYASNRIKVPLYKKDVKLHVKFFNLNQIEYVIPLDKKVENSVVLPSVLADSVTEEQKSFITLVVKELQTRQKKAMKQHCALL